MTRYPRHRRPRSRTVAVRSHRGRSDLVLPRTRTTDRVGRRRLHQTPESHRLPPRANRPRVSSGCSRQASADSRGLRSIRPRPARTTGRRAALLHLGPMPFVLRPGSASQELTSTIVASAAARWTASQPLCALALDGHVLDMACGTGYWTEQLAGRAASVTALDGSQAMLEQVGVFPIQLTPI